MEKINLYLLTAFSLFVASLFPLCSCGPSLSATDEKRPLMSVDRIPSQPDRPPAGDLPSRLHKPENLDEAHQQQTEKGLPQDGDEVVDMETEIKPNGDVNLKFTSHGRRHELELTESRQKLADIPIRLLGASSDFEQQVAAEMKKIKMMVDKKRGATVAFKMENSTLEPLFQSGVFKFGQHQFDMKSGDSALSEKGKTKVTRTPVKDLKGVRRDYVIPKSFTREKRAANDIITSVSANVELVVMVDYSAWNAMSSQTPLQTAQNILLYFAHMVQIMDNHYGAMQNDDISISVQLVQILALSTANVFANIVEDHKLTSSGGMYILGNAALDRLTEWLETTAAVTALSNSYDHVMLFTAYDMVDDEDGSSSVAGLAWKGTMCDPSFSSSLVETGELLTFDASVAAHELGHSLGADHDGQSGSSSGCDDENYVMAAAIGSESFLSNIFLFSCCSQRSFYDTVTRNGSCLSNTDSSPFLGSTVSQSLPGEIYSADDQCYIRDGTEACGDWVYEEKTYTICANLWCVSADNLECESRNIPAADGTPCGANTWCYQGECVAQDSTNTPRNLGCDVRDCYTGESRCSGDFNTFDTSYLQCYPDSAACNGFSDCSDGSDELNCGSNCYVCSDSSACVTTTSQCEAECPSDDGCEDGVKSLQSTGSRVFVGSTFSLILTLSVFLCRT